jgi:hypothetical protein
MARSTSNSNRRPLSKARKPSRIPLSCQSRPKTKSGPSRSTDTASNSPAAWASSTAKAWQWLEAGAHEPFQLTAGLQQVEPAQGGNDLLTHLFAVPNAVRDLQITVGTGGFDAEKHGRMAWVYLQQP